MSAVTAWALLLSNASPTPFSGKPSTSVPGCQVPARAASSVVLVATSSSLTMLVSTRPGCSAFWLLSTPMPYFPASAAACSTPTPVAPAAWNTTSAPRSICERANSAPRTGSAQAAGVEPVMFCSTSTFGLAARAPCT